MKKNGLLIGAHVSAAGGLYNAFENGEKINAQCIQIFTKSNRQWRAKKITPEGMETFVEKQKNSSVTCSVAHAAYLINLGSKNDETISKSIKALVEELQRCETLNIPYLVLHPGTQRFENIDASLKFTAQNINTAIQESQTNNVTLLIETMAGQGSTIGHTFEQIGSIIKNIVLQKQVGVCLDTCHIFAAGYDFDTQQKYNAMMDNFEKKIGIEKIKIIHMNDSKKERGSRVDRHEHIGKGKIGENAFSFLLKDKRLQSVPKILETPKDENEIESDLKNLETLRRLSK